MKTFSLMLLVLFGLNISACNSKDAGKTEDFDIEREEEFDVNDIRERELELNK